MVSRAAVLAKASEWVGMQERSGNNDIWFSDDWGITGQSWCFAFVQSCFYYADPSPSGALPHQSMYCPFGIQWARNNGQAIEVGQGDPTPGDIVFFSWDMANWGRFTPGTGDHVGIVESYDGGDTIWTIEGNVGSPQGVYRKVRSISETVVCFWRPSVYDDSFGPAALPAQPEDDMFEQADRDRLAQIADGATRAGAKNAPVSFVRDPRDGSIWIVWGLMWRRYIGTPELLAGYQNWATTIYGTDAEIRDWNPIHIDDVPRADVSAASPAPEPTVPAEPPPPVVPPAPAVPPPPVQRPNPPTDPSTEEALAARVAQLEGDVKRILDFLEATHKQPEQPAA